MKTLQHLLLAIIAVLVSGIVVSAQNNNPFRQSEPQVLSPNAAE
jgi:hypothetical protein